VENGAREGIGGGGEHGQDYLDNEPDGRSGVYHNSTFCVPFFGYEFFPKEKRMSGQRVSQIHAKKPSQSYHLIKTWILFGVISLVVLSMSACNFSRPVGPALPTATQSPVNPPTAPISPTGVTPEQTATQVPPEGNVSQPTATPTIALRQFSLDTASGQPGLAWTSTFPKQITHTSVRDDGQVFAFSIESPFSNQGVFYQLSEGDNLFILNADGTVNATTSLQLETPLGVIETSNDFFSRSIEAFIPPKVLPDGTILFITAENVVTAMAPTGQILWEFPLEAVPKSMPILSGAAYYALDEKATLYAFDANGLVWSTTSAAAPNTASGISVAEDGRIYYTVTTFSRAFLQAVSPAGEGLWATELQTDSFYDPVRISLDGQLVAVHDDLVDGASGELLSVNLPVEVGEYIPGYDGSLYARSGQSILRLESSAGGFEISNTVDLESPGGVAPGMVAVDANHVIWLYYWGSTDSTKQVVWVSQAGEVLGNTALPQLQADFSEPDYQQSRIMVCETSQNFQRVDCGLHSPLSPELLWEETFEGRGSLHDQTALEGDYLYFSTWDGTVYKLFLGG
jgi:hypothetical protein